MQKKKHHCLFLENRAKSCQDNQEMIYLLSDLLIFSLPPTVCLYFISKNNSELSFFSKLCGKNAFVKSFRVLSLNIKLINGMQKYSHIIELQACILKIFATIFLLSNVLISLGMSSTPKVTLLPFTYKDIQRVPIDFYSLRLNA